MTYMQRYRELMGIKAQMDFLRNQPNYGSPHGERYYQGLRKKYNRLKFWWMKTV